MIVKLYKCHKESHNHGSERVANHCMAHLYQNANLFRWADDKLFSVLKRRESGETLASIAKSYDISTERIRQIVAKAIRLRSRLTSQ